MKRYWEEDEDTLFTPRGTAPGQPREEDDDDDLEEVSYNDDLDLDDDGLTEDEDELNEDWEEDEL